MSLLYSWNCCQNAFQKNGKLWGCAKRVPRQLTLNLKERKTKQKCLRSFFYLVARDETIQKQKLSHLLSNVLEVWEPAADCLEDDNSMSLLDYLDITVLWTANSEWRHSKSWKVISKKRPTKKLVIQYGNMWTILISSNKSDNQQNGPGNVCLSTGRTVWI